MSGSVETKGGQAPSTDSGGRADVVVIPVDRSQQSEAAFECKFQMKSIFGVRMCVYFRGRFKGHAWFDRMFDSVTCYCCIPM